MKKRPGIIPGLFLSYRESLPAQISSMFAKRFFNAQKLIVFGYSVAAAWGTGFDLTGMNCYGQIRNCSILRFSGTV